MPRITDYQKHNNFYLPQHYKHRPDNKHWDDRGWEDQWQKPVYGRVQTICRSFYEHEKRKPVVLDIGCGSGYKLMKMIEPLARRVVGTELEPCLSDLKRSYPDGTWIESELNGTYQVWEEGCDPDAPPMTFDVIMSADVIEHIQNPYALLLQIARHDPEYFILSTPERVSDGPPKNPCHVREWNQPEFEQMVDAILGDQYKIVSSLFRAGSTNAILLQGTRRF